MEISNTIFLFGAAEKGPFCSPLLCQDLIHLFTKLGNAPSDTTGIDYAVQALLFQRDVVYFRVTEEGFSTAEYYEGLKLLRDQKHHFNLCAIATPGLGDRAVMDAVIPICRLHNSVLLISEKDFYDFLTN